MSKSPWDVFFGLLFQVTLKDSTLIEDNYGNNTKVANSKFSSASIQASKINSHSDEKPDTYRKRVVYGYLLAVDYEGNLLLSNTKETIKEFSQPATINSGDQLKITDFGSNSNVNKDDPSGAQDKESIHPKSKISKQRYLGMLSIPRDSIEGIQVEKNKYERFSRQ